MDTAKASREVYGNAKPRRRIRRLPEQPAAAEQNAQESERARQRQGTARGGSGGPWGTAPPAAAHPPGAAATGAAAAPPYSGTPGGPAAAVHRAAPRPQQRSSYHAQQPTGAARRIPPMLQTAPAGPAGDPCGHSGGHSAVGRGDYLLLPSNKAVENVPVGTEQTAQAGRLVAPVPYADSDGSDNGGPSIDWGTIGRCSRPKPILTPPPRRPPTWCRSLAG